MGHPRYAPTLTTHRQVAIDLNSQPEDQQKRRWNANDGDENSEKHQRLHLGLWKQHQICAEYSGDGPAGADHGNFRPGIHEDMAHGRNHPANQIESDEPDFAQHIFDIVPEYPEKKHIARQMHEPGMQKHRGEHVGIGLNRCLYKMTGNQAVVGEQRGDVARIRKLPEKYEDIRPDQRNGEQREVPGRVFVVKREKHVFLSGCKSEYDRL